MITNYWKVSKLYEEIHIVRCISMYFGVHYYKFDKTMLMKCICLIILFKTYFPSTYLEGHEKCDGISSMVQLWLLLKNFFIQLTFKDVLVNCVAWKLQTSLVLCGHMIRNSQTCASLGNWLIIIIFFNGRRNLALKAYDWHAFRHAIVSGHKLLWWGKKWWARQSVGRSEQMGKNLCHNCF